MQLLNESVSFKLTDYMQECLRRSQQASRDTHPLRHLYQGSPTNKFTSVRKRAQTAKADQLQFDLTKRYLQSQNSRYSRLVIKRSKQSTVSKAKDQKYVAENTPQGQEVQTIKVGDVQVVNPLTKLLQKNSLKGYVKTEQASKQYPQTPEKSYDRNDGLQRSITLYFSEKSRTLRKQLRRKHTRTQNSQTEDQFRTTNASRYIQTEEKRLQTRAQSSYLSTRRYNSKTEQKDQSPAFLKTFSNSLQWRQRTNTQPTINTKSPQKQVLLLRKKTADLCQKLRSMSQKESVSNHVLSVSPDSLMRKRQRALNLTAQAIKDKLDSKLGLEAQKNVRPKLRGEDTMSEEWFKKQEAIIKINIQKSLQLREKRKATKLAGKMNNKTVQQLIGEVKV